MSKLQELIDEQFHKNNFLIEETVSITNEKWAAVYCSSNGVYPKDTVEDFSQKILKTDNYEWYRTRVPYAQKHIFIRDVSKKFYQFGINDNGLDNLEKIAEMIKKETEGYKIMTIGSSSGAMAAIVLSNLLNAEFSIAFSPILRPYKPDEPKEVIANKLATKEYFDAIPFTQSAIPIFFLYPNGSWWDIYNSSLVENNSNVYFVPIISNVHGVPINKRILAKILQLGKEDLKKVFKYTTKDCISEFTFARLNWGGTFYLLRVVDYIKKYPLFLFRKDFYTLVLR